MESISASSLQETNSHCYCKKVCSFQKTDNKKRFCPQNDVQVSHYVTQFIHLQAPLGYLVGLNCDNNVDFFGYVT